MEVVKVLHMNGGIGDASYAKNSLLQKNIIMLAKPIIEEAITELFTRMLPETICIADLGCSSGPNAFLAVSDLIKNIEKKCKSLKQSEDEASTYQIYLNDLSTNDFNTIFKCLPNSQKSLAELMGCAFGHCFIAGVPGSFYERLFPNKTIHFVHSSSSLMWLSQVPDLEEVNKGKIHLSSTSSPSVIRAYIKQFERDFTTFLRCRAEELVPGGVMVLTFVGRKNQDHLYKESGYIYELLSKVLNELVSEGKIEEEQLDTFNMPQYFPSTIEVKQFVEEEGSFSIIRILTKTIHWTGYDSAQDHGLIDDGCIVSNFMRAVIEPLFIFHFGEAIMDEIFLKYKEILKNCRAEENTEFTNVTVSLKRIV